MTEREGPDLAGTDADLTVASKMLLVRIIGEQDEATTYGIISFCMDDDWIAVAHDVDSDSDDPPSSQRLRSKPEATMDAAILAAIGMVLERESYSKYTHTLSVDSLIDDDQEESE